MTMLPRQLAVVFAALVFAVLTLPLAGISLAADDPPPKPRLLVLTDIGGDPDDQQSLIRLMLYSNEFEIEGLIASAAGVPGELKEEVVRPELIREIVEAYGRVRDNLLLHARGYAEASQLLRRIKTGNPKRGKGSLGDGHDTDGSRWIIETVDRDDRRPLNVTIWGGSTELAQALWRVRHDRGEAGLKRFLSRLHVYAINHQDDTGPWIIENFPDLFYILARQPEKHDKREAAYRGMYLGGDESLTSGAWLDAHVRKNHGPLGALYPNRTWTEPNPHAALKEGDTPSWFYFLPTGLNDPQHPEWGGWGGRFEKARGGLYRDARDTVGKVRHARTTVWRWRPAFQADFQARMDWCVKPVGQANHAPLAKVNGQPSREIVQLTPKPGADVVLDASGSTDPDDNRLAYRWYVYPEAGTYGGDVRIENGTAARAPLRMPRDAAGKTIHVILEVTDDGSPRLTAFRRVVVRGERE